MNKNIIKLATCTLLTSYLFAIDDVGTITKNSPITGATYSTEDTVTFSWPSVTNANKYFFVIDNNSSTNPAESNSSIRQEVSSSQAVVNFANSRYENLDGTYYFHVQAVDASGTDISFNTSRISFDLDTIIPSQPTITLEGQNVNISGSENIYFTTNGTDPNNNSYQYSLPLKLAVGTTIKAVQYDNAGNKGAISDPLSFPDTYNPTVKIASDNLAVDGRTFATNDTKLISTVTAKQYIKVANADTTEGFTRYKYKKSTDTSYITVSDITTNIDISDLQSGTYTYNILGGDAYNYKLESNKKTVTFTVDNDAPTSLNIMYDANSSISIVNPSTVDGTAEMTISATAASEYGYKVTTAAAECPTSYANYTKYTTPFNLGTESSLTHAQQIKVCMAARDTVGNWSKTSKLYTIDKQGPIVSLQDGQKFSGTLNINLSSESESDTIRYKVVSNASSPCTDANFDTYDELPPNNIYSEAIEISGSDSCVYTASMDSLGNKGDVNASFFEHDVSQATISSIDLSDNAVFATVDTYGATPYTDINITANNVKTLSYEFDNNSTVYTQNYSDTSDNLISLASLDSAEHNITIIAYSDNNETNDTRNISFTIDNTQPTAYGVADYNSSLLWESTDALNIDLAKLADEEVYYSLNEGTDYTKATTLSSTSARITLTQTSNLFTKKIDLAGNESDEYNATITQNIPIQTYTLNKGWNLTTLPTKSLSESGLNSAYVWDYNGTAWGNNIADDIYEDFSSTSSSKGYWVYLDASKNIQIDGDDTSNSTISGASTGWSLLGTTSSISYTSGAYITWTYDNGIWKYATTNSELNTTLDTLGYTPIESIEAFSGYWIYKD